MQVPLFSKMDSQLLDAICQRLISSLNTRGTYIVREGDPVNEMLFIIRGRLDSSTTGGGRSGFFNSITLKLGDFCGEELLTWALMTNSHVHLPASTRTVRCITEVEAFALRAQDLKFFANQFKRLHSKKLQHSFRYHSHQWRTWAAYIVQTAWRQRRRRKLAEELIRHENKQYIRLEEEKEEEIVDNTNNSSCALIASNALTTTLLATRFVTKTKKAIRQKAKFARAEDSTSAIPKLFKPEEPHF